MKGNRMTRREAGVGQARRPRPVRVAALAGFLALGAAGWGSPLAGQVAAGWTAGAGSFSDLNPDSGAPVGLAPTTVRVLGLHFDRWFGGSERVGFRLAGAWQAPDVPWVQGDRTIDVVSGDVSLMVRLITTRDDEGLSVLPYVMGGFGGIWYDLGDGDPAGFPAAGTFHDGERRISPVAVYGAGLDLGLPFRWFGNPMRLRVEAADHYALESPLLHLSSGDREGPVHNYRVTLGLYSLLGPLR